MGVVSGTCRRLHTLIETGAGKPGIVAAPALIGNRQPCLHAIYARGREAFDACALGIPCIGTTASGHPPQRQGVIQRGCSVIGRRRLPEQAFSPPPVGYAISWVEAG